MGEQVNNYRGFTSKPLKINQEGVEMDTNHIDAIRNIFYRLINDKNITIDEVREAAKEGYIAAHDLNQDIKGIYSAIGNLMSI